MDLFLWYLVLENIILLPAIGLFFYSKQRPYVIIGCILFVILICTDIALYRGYRGVFVALPTVIVLFIGFFIRPFLPRPHVTINPQISKFVALILLFIVIVTCVFVVVFFARLYLH